MTQPQFTGYPGYPRGHASRLRGAILSTSTHAAVSTLSVGHTVPHHRTRFVSLPHYTHRNNKLMCVTILQNDDEAYQRVRSRPTVRRGRGPATPTVGRFCRSLERDQLRTSTELRRSRRRRVGNQRVPWSVRRDTRCVDGPTDRTEEPRSVEVVFQPQRERRSQRQTRLLGQRRRRTRTANIHPQHVVHCRVGRILSARNSGRTRPKRRVRSWIPRTSPARSSGRTQLEAVRQTRSVGVVLG